MKSNHDHPTPAQPEPTDEEVIARVRRVVQRLPQALPLDDPRAYTLQCLKRAGALHLLADVQQSRRRQRRVAAAGLIIVLLIAGLLGWRVFGNRQPGGPSMPAPTIPASSPAEPPAYAPEPDIHGMSCAIHNHSAGTAMSTTKNEVFSLDEYSHETQVNTPRRFGWVFKVTRRGASFLYALKNDPNQNGMLSGQSARSVFGHTEKAEEYIYFVVILADEALKGFGADGAVPWLTDADTAALQAQGAKQSPLSDARRLVRDALVRHEIMGAVEVHVDRYTQIRQTRK